ncbi:MAG TPA: hypothetical protein ENJ79_10710 [Gammaproteobacteria bacterium]|nr:hypothetical protein [Gammaproteobacteria bacterium]
MSVASLRLERARRQLAAFCRARMGARPVVDCALQDDALLLRFDGEPGLRLEWDGAAWRVSWRAAQGWKPWPQLPRAADMTVLIDALEQAPLHVHW